MNIHHLELFYYVARFGGISEAVRNIPYGIQQPAVSGQILQLEEFLGVTLFQRRPFELTPAGATHPHGHDPHDRTIRIAPSFPELPEVAQAAEGVVLSVLLAMAFGFWLTRPLRHMHEMIWRSP